MMSKFVLERKKKRSEKLADAKLADAVELSKSLRWATVVQSGRWWLAWLRHEAKSSC